MFAFLPRMGGARVTELSCTPGRSFGGPEARRHHGGKLRAKWASRYSMTINSPRGGACLNALANKARLTKGGVIANNESRIRSRSGADLAVYGLCEVRLIYAQRLVVLALR